MNSTEQQFIYASRLGLIFRNVSSVSRDIHIVGTLFNFENALVNSSDVQVIFFDEFS